jgi:hypothetical protein
MSGVPAKEETMTYSKYITRKDPGCFLFLVDQSASMSDKLDEGSKADQVAAALNKLLQELAAVSSKDEGIRDYFDIGVIGYGNNGSGNALKGPLSSQLLNPISVVAENPVRVESRKRKISDGAGGLVEVDTNFPVWYEPVANGGTPMRAALMTAAETLIDWCDAHPGSFPPVLIHITDGESTDGDPEDVARTIGEISTSDGKTIVMNVHISGGPAEEITFPDTEDRLSSLYAKLLFRMSSTLSGGMLDAAQSLGFNANEQSRAFMFNAKTEQIIQFLQIGSTPANNLR